MNWKKYKKPTWTCPLQFTITSPGTLKISYLGYSAQINKWLWKWIFKLELNLKKKKNSLVWNFAISKNSQPDSKLRLNASIFWQIEQLDSRLKCDSAQLL